MIGGIKNWVKRHWPRLRLRTILFATLFLVAALPGFGAVFLRVYENTLVRQTEAELVAESTWLLADKPLEIIDGSHRWEAARNAGLARVPVTVIEATDAQAASLRVGMNKIRGELDLATVGRIDLV